MLTANKTVLICGDVFIYAGNESNTFILFQRSERRLQVFL